MTESEWLASTDPAAMLAWALNPGVDGRNREAQCEAYRRLNARKLRLFAVACAQAVVDYNAYAAFERGHPAVSDIQWATDWAKPHHEGLGHSQQEKAAFLRCIVGNPFRPVALPKVGVVLRGQQPDGFGGQIESEGYSPWLTPAVLTIAQTIYDDNQWGDTPILADALEEAGCTDEEILRHLRGEEPVIAEDKRAVTTDLRKCYRLVGWRRRPVPCVRGCHVIDLILGKE